MERQLPTLAIQATDWWEAVLALVYLQEDGLGVHLPVKVCCHCMCVHSDGGGGGKHFICSLISVDYKGVCLNIQRMRLPSKLHKHKKQNN